MGAPMVPDLTSFIVFVQIASDMSLGLDLPMVRTCRIMSSDRASLSRWKTSGLRVGLTSKSSKKTEVEALPNMPRPFKHISGTSVSSMPSSSCSAFMSSVFTLSPNFSAVHDAVWFATLCLSSNSLTSSFSLFNLAVLHAMTSLLGFSKKSRILKWSGFRLVLPEKGCVSFFATPIWASGDKRPSGIPFTLDSTPTSSRSGRDGCPSSSERVSSAVTPFSTLSHISCHLHVEYFCNVLWEWSVRARENLNEALNFSSLC